MSRSQVKVHRIKMFLYQPQMHVTKRDEPTVAKSISEFETVKTSWLFVKFFLVNVTSSEGFLVHYNGHINPSLTY